jgi:dolichyl-phosphate-mannose-protein mannosyltransferase
VAISVAPPSAETDVPEIVQRRLSSRGATRDQWSWLAAGLVTVVAAIVRLVNLSRPEHIVFDEVYYAPHGYTLWQYGVEWSIQEDGANPVNGAPLIGETAAYVVHPPLGKWMIALGEMAFGYTPFGWRIAAAVVGILSVLMITRIAQRLFGSVVLGATAGLLVALDGMHLVLSRSALLDIFLMFFVVAAFGALVLDRDQRRRRWLEAAAAGRTRLGYGLRELPWWRFAAAAALGCATGVKWSGAFFIPLFLALMVAWEIGARRSAGVRRPWLATLRDETPTLAISLVIIPLVYLATWTGWFLERQEGYFRHWRADNGMSEPFLLGPLFNLVKYHQAALDFHGDLSDPHLYESSPWQWLLLARPVAFHWNTAGNCGAESCASQVLLLGTPLLWWSFLPALAAMIWFGFARRDWRVPAILSGVAAGIGPWFLFDRVQFFFYALPAEPFLVLTVVYVLGALINPAGGAGRRLVLFDVDRRTLAVMLAGTYVLLVAVNFAYFYPIYTGWPIPYEAWQSRMWLSSWV